MIYRDPDAYSPWPVLWPLPDGSIGAGVVTSPIGSHPGASTFGRFLAMASRDGGRTWQSSDHPAHPANWPFGTADEHMDRFAVVLPDPGGDTFVTVGAHGFEAWDAGRLDEARSQHRWVRMLPERPDHIAAQSPLLISRRSTDGGRTWDVREWEVPGVQGFWCFNRGVVMHDGALAVSVYTHDHDGDERPYVLRSENAGRTWRLHDLCANAKAVPANETALCEVAPGKLIALTRSDPGRDDHRGDDSRMLAFGFLNTAPVRKAGHRRFHLLRGREMVDLPGRGFTLFGAACSRRARWAASCAGRRGSGPRSHMVPSTELGADSDEDLVIPRS